MGRLFIGIILLCAVGVCIADFFRPDNSNRNFRCYPTRHIRLQTYQQIPVFLCKHRNEEFVLASSDFVETSNEVFDIKVHSDTFVKSNAIIHQPITIAFGVVPSVIAPGQFYVDEMYDVSRAHRSTSGQHVQTSPEQDNSGLRTAPAPA